MNVTSHNCVYINCENNNRHQKGKSFFKFPVNNAAKVKEWQKNCGNVTIACMEVNELKYKLLCEDHFLAEDIIFSDTSRKRKVLRKKAVPLKYTPQVDSPQLSTYEDVAPLFYDVKQEPASEMISIEETKLFQMPTVSILEDGPQPSTTEDVAPDSYGIKQEPEFETNSKEETKLFQMETEDGSKPSTTRDVPDCYDIKQEPEFETNSEEETKLFQMETDDSPQPSTYEDVDPFFHDIKQESASETISEEETKLFQTPTDNLAWLPPSKLPKLEAADEPSTYTASISSTTLDKSKVSDLISQMASPSQGSKTEVVQWTRQQLFDAVHEEWDKNLDTLIEILGVKLLNKAAHLFHIEDRSRQALKKVICNLKMKWRNAYRIEDRFLKNNKSWLDDSISITVVFLDQEASANDSVDSTKSRHSGGRPQTSFFESSDRSKRRKAQKLGESYSADELSYATKMVLRESGAISAGYYTSNTYMPGMLKVGDKFSSFADAKKAIEELGERTYTTFWKRDARTIASSKIVRPIESSLIYYQLLYACNHGGKKFKSCGKNIRKSWTFKEDCPAHVRFKASSDGKALEVTSVQSNHNHATSKILHAHTPNQRRLSSHVQENVKDYLNMKADRKMVQQKLQEGTGKIVTLQDLTNMRKHDQSKRENLDNCLNMLKTKYGAHAAVWRDEDNNFRGLFIQSPTMKSTMRAFPEFLAVDATYKLLKIGLPVFLIIVEDGNCQTEIVGVCILASEDKESFTWFLETFKHENPSWINVKCIMTDKDLNEREVIKNCFPAANLIICVFHTLKIFHCEISCQKLGITPSQRTLSLELIKKLVYAETDDDYEKYLEDLKNSAPRTVYEYFTKTWNSSKDEWNLGKNYFKNNFLNNTNNRLESISAKLKSVIDKNSPLEHFINSLFTIISSLETERDHKAVYGILKKPVNMFPEDSDEKKYFKLLTREASKHVLREIRLAKCIGNICISADGSYTIIDNRGSTQTTVSSCTCVIHNAMILPCKHIFALRKYLQVELFDATLVNPRWTMAYYKENRRTLTSFLEGVEPTEHDPPRTSNIQSTSLTTQRYQSPSSYTQRRKKCLLLCTELADLAAQRTGTLFEQRLNVLKTLKTMWANDTDVAIAHVDDRDENHTQFTIGNNDEIVFENERQLSLESYEFCNEMVVQRTNEVFVLSNGNPSSPVPSKIIEETVIQDPN